MTDFFRNKFYIVFIYPFFLGSILIFAFSPFNLTFLNFLSFSFLLYLILLIKKKNFNNFNFFYLGCSFGFGFFLFGNYWISISLTHDDNFKYLIPFALIFIPLFLSLFLGIVAFIVGSYASQNIFFILLFSTIFSIFEFLRGNILTGFPWNLVAYTWSWSPESIQILSVIGTYSFSLISITLFSLPFLFFQKKIHKKNVFLAIFFFILLVFNYLYGYSKIRENKFKFSENIKVKVISPNLTLQEFQSNDEVLLLQDLIRHSEPEKDIKTLFIWPEGIFYESYLSKIKKYKNIFSKHFSEKHLIILGINNFVRKSNNTNYFNSLVLLNNQLEILAVYNKKYLVPFGEFLPLESILSKIGLKKVTRGYNSFSPGKYRENIILDNSFENKIILPLICYEIIYSGKIKNNKDQSPDLVINISEDAWFGDSIGPHQHFSKAIYRAVEEGVFVARSANMGISAIIDPNGIPRKILKKNQKGSIEYNFPSYFNKSTLFSKYGNKIFFLIIFLYILLTLILKNFKSNE